MYVINTFSVLMTKRTCHINVMSRSILKCLFPWQNFDDVFIIDMGARIWRLVATVHSDSRTNIIKHQDTYSDDIFSTFQWW